MRLRDGDLDRLTEGGDTNAAGIPAPAEGAKFVLDHNVSRGLVLFQGKLILLPPAV